MSLTQIGEFSFIIAGVGLAIGRDAGVPLSDRGRASRRSPLSRTPWLIRAGGPFASWVDRKLPRPIQTFAGLYGSWMASLRSSPTDQTRRSRERRLAGLLVLDAVLLGAIGLASRAPARRRGRRVSRKDGPISPPRPRSWPCWRARPRWPRPWRSGCCGPPAHWVRRSRCGRLPAPTRGVDLGAAPAARLSGHLATGDGRHGRGAARGADPAVPAQPSRARRSFSQRWSCSGSPSGAAPPTSRGHTRAGAEVIVAALAKQMAGAREQPDAPMSHRRRASDSGDRPRDPGRRTGTGAHAGGHLRPDPGPGATGLGRDRARGLRGRPFARPSSTCATRPTRRCW